MKKYIRTLMQIIRMSQNSATIYRVDYFLRIIRAILDVWVSYIIITAIYLQTATIGGWDKWEALLVFGIFQSIYTFIYLFFGYGIVNLGLDIINGQIDRYLTKPIDSQFLATTQITFVTHAFRLIFGLFVLSLALINIEITLSVWQILLGFVAFLSGAVIYYCLSFMLSVTSFWTFSSEAWEMITTLTSAARFPTDIFGKGLNFLVHVIPLAFVATVPAKAILGRDYYLAIISPVIAVVLFYISRKFWKLGLMAYDSVSS